MAFGKIKSDLAVPPTATATYAFYELYLCSAGPPILTCRHAGDGTPGYKTAEWAYLNATHQARASKVHTPAKTEAQCIEVAKILARHCVMSWVNVFDDGETTPSPCTPEKVLEFLTAIITAENGLTAFGQFREWISNRESFYVTPPMGDPVALGKP